MGWIGSYFRRRKRTREDGSQPWLGADNFLGGKRAGPSPLVEANPWVHSVSMERCDWPAGAAVGFGTLPGQHADPTRAAHLPRTGRRSESAQLQLSVDSTDISTARTSSLVPSVRCGQRRRCNYLLHVPGSPPILQHCPAGEACAPAVSPLDPQTCPSNVHGPETVRARSGNRLSPAQRAQPQRENKKKNKKNTTTTTTTTTPALSHHSTNGQGKKRNNLLATPPGAQTPYIRVLHPVPAAKRRTAAESAADTVDGAAGTQVRFQLHRSPRNAAAMR